jgi:hypothetical protein
MRFLSTLEVRGSYRRQQVVGGVVGDTQRAHELDASGTDREPGGRKPDEFAWIRRIFAVLVAHVVLGFILGDALVGLAVEQVVMTTIVLEVIEERLIPRQWWAENGSARGMHMRT